MDEFSGYNQIKMHKDDIPNVSFITDLGVFCYLVMAFGLKNAEQLIKVKSLVKTDHITHLREALEVLRYHKMMLNPVKCAFGVGSGIFLGLMVSKRGIEANPDKIKAILDMEPPRSIKAIRKLTGRVVAFGRFISKSGDKCFPFFKSLKKVKDFKWTEESQETFERLKKYMVQAPFLAKPALNETLYLYLAVSDNALSAVLVKEELKVHKPISYVNKILHGAELNYSTIKKFVLALLDFLTTNNEAEYEALIVGLSLAGTLRVKNLKVCGDSKLVISQVKGEFEARDETMARYVHLVRVVMTQFDKFHVEHIPREENAKADALSKFASSEIEKSSGSVYFRVLKTRSIDVKLVAPIGLGTSWIDPIKAHIQTGWLPNDVNEPSEMLTSINSPILFVIWGMDILESFPMAIVQRKFLIVAIDYFIEWIEAKPFAKITTKTQFNSEEFKKYCEENKIELRFTSVAHPQANGQAEVENRVILDGMKKRIEKSRNNWVDEILSMLWAYRATCGVTTGATPFMLAYGAEAVVPVEISHSSPRIQAYHADENEEGKRLTLDLINEIRDAAHAKIVEYQEKGPLFITTKGEREIL
ncbi:hypothetical protein AgCh_010101 [Apium graveolens]